MIHKLRKHLYLEADGRNQFETRGWVTGMPTHYGTACGLQVRHAPNRVYNSPLPPGTSYHWAGVTCPDCLARRFPPKKVRVRCEHCGSWYSRLASPSPAS